MQELKINKEQLHQDKKGFDFLKKLTSSSSDEPTLLLSVKPFQKLTEKEQLHLAILPPTLLLNKKLLIFASAFRLHCFKRLSRAQHQMLAPSGNFAIAQFRKLFDNPDVNLLLADAWDFNEQQNTTAKPEDAIPKMEDFLLKMYAVIHWEEFRFDHVYPTRSSNIDSKLYAKREEIVLSQLAPARYRKIKKA